MKPVNLYGLTRKQALGILDRIAAQETGESGVIAFAATALRGCRPSKTCKSPLCPDYLHRKYIVPIHTDLSSAFSDVAVGSLLRVHLRAPGLVPGDHRFRRCLLQLREAVAEFTEAGTPFHAVVGSYAGLVHPTYKHAAKDDAGFQIVLRLLCVVHGEIDAKELDRQWRPLVLRKHVTPHGPWAREEPLVTIYPVHSAPGAIDLVSRMKAPLPRNLADIPAETIIEAFGYPRLLFHLYGHKTL